MAGKIVVTLQDASPEEQAQFLEVLREAGFGIEAALPAPGEEISPPFQALTKVLTHPDPPAEDLFAVLEGVSHATRLPVALFLPVKERALLACRAASSGTPPAWIEAEFPAGSAEISLKPEEGYHPHPIPLVKNDLAAGLLVAGFRGTPPEEEVLSVLGGLAEAIGEAREKTQRLRALDRGASLLDSSVDAMVEACAKLLELRGHETAGHSERVTALAVRLGERLGLSGRELVDLRRGALLHDIGKLTLPDSLLQKSPPLTEEDWKTMRTHTVRAYEAFRSVPALRGALDVPLRHHERFDGSGYPDGLKGADIPLAARIFAVVDVWDALLSETSFRRRWTPERALDHLRRASGVQFDPNVVSAFASLLEEDPSLLDRPF
jgi:hypothetical protein